MHRLEPASATGDLGWQLRGPHLVPFTPSWHLLLGGHEAVSTGKGTSPQDEMSLGDGKPPPPLANG